MQNSSFQAPNSVVERTPLAPLESVCARLRQLRAEFAPRRSSGAQAAPEARELGEVFGAWEQLEQDPRELLFLLIACGWMFRVGPADELDVDRELGKLVAAVASTLGRRDAGLAYLLGETLRPEFTRTMLGTRYWQPGQAWCTPGPHALELQAAVRSREAFKLKRPAPAVPARNGRVPQLHAHMAAVVVVHRLRERGFPSRAVPIGQALATALLGRTAPVTHTAVTNWTVAAYGDPSARLEAIGPGYAVPEHARDRLTTVAGMPEASLPGLSARLEHAFAAIGWRAESFERCCKLVGLDERDPSPDVRGRWLDEMLRTLLAEWGVRIIPWAYSIKLGGLPTELRTPARGKARRVRK